MRKLFYFTEKQAKEHSAIMSALHCHVMFSFMDVLIPLISFIRDETIQVMVYNVVLTSIRSWYPLLSIAKNFEQFSAVINKMKKSVLEQWGSVAYALGLRSDSEF